MLAISVSARVRVRMVPLREAVICRSELRARERLHVYSKPAEERKRFLQRHLGSASMAFNCPTFTLPALRGAGEAAADKKPLPHTSASPVSTVRSVRANSNGRATIREGAFPHPVLPGSHPHRAALGVQGWVMHADRRQIGFLQSLMQSRRQRASFQARYAPTTDRPSERQRRAPPVTLTNTVPTNRKSAHSRIDRFRGRKPLCRGEKYSARRGVENRKQDVERPQLLTVVVSAARMFYQKPLNRCTFEPI